MKGDHCEDRNNVGRCHKESAKNSAPEVHKNTRKRFGDEHLSNDSKGLV